MILVETESSVKRKADAVKDFSRRRGDFDKMAFNARVERH
jgi:hypothetical protein